MPFSPPCFFSLNIIWRSHCRLFRDILPYFYSYKVLHSAVHQLWWNTAILMNLKLFSISWHFNPIGHPYRNIFIIISLIPSFCPFCLGTLLWTILKLASHLNLSFPFLLIQHLNGSNSELTFHIVSSFFPLKKLCCIYIIRAYTIAAYLEYMLYNAY